MDNIFLIKNDISEKDLKRFNKYFDTTDCTLPFYYKKQKLKGTCWIWKNYKDKNGYGQIIIDKKNIRAHRLSYEIYNGEIPDDKFILHQCDNPSCVNPYHLKIGSHQDNMNEMKERKRVVTLKGEKSNLSVIKDKSIIKEIRDLYKTGEYYQYKLASMYGVSQSNISYIVNNKSWNHI